MELVLVRHGLPIRVEGAGDGADPPLAPQGRLQAEAVAELVAAEPVDVLYTSPLRRAVETAAPIGAAVGHVAAVVEGLAEFDRHQDHYVPVEELRAEGGQRWQDLVAGRWGPDGSVSPQAFRAGVVATFEALVDAHRGQRVVVVSHGGVTNAYLSWVLGIDKVLFFEPTYCSVSRVLATASGLRSVRSLNEHAHVRHLLG